VIELETGPLFRFTDWPNENVPRRAAGVYAIWRADQLVYVGMSGRGAQREDFVASSDDTARQAKGLWTRLNSHASGRRSGDQFNVYVCDRFVVPVLTAHQQHQIGHSGSMYEPSARVASSRAMASRSAFRAASDISIAELSRSLKIRNSIWSKT
jgi:hypothetical protein